MDTTEFTQEELFFIQQQQVQEAQSVVGREAAEAMSLFVAGAFGLTILVIFILTALAYFQIYRKAGKSWWIALIPIWSTIVLLQITKLPVWFIFLYLTIFIPFVGVGVVSVVHLITMWKLGEAFGKSPGFNVGLMLLSPIFLMILAFDKSRYLYAPHTPDTQAPAPPPYQDPGITF